MGDKPDSHLASSAVCYRPTMVKIENLNKDVSNLNCLFLFQCFIHENALTL